MSLSIITQTAECRIDATKFSDLIAHLVEVGYQALLSEAKSKFLAVLGGVGSGRLVEAESEEDEYYMYRSFASARRIRYPMASDIFIDSKSSGVLYLALFGDDRTIPAPRREKSVSKQLEVGFVGSSQGEDALQRFVGAVSVWLGRHKVDAQFARAQPQSGQFGDLSSGKEATFTAGTSITEPEIATAEVLRDVNTRSLGILIKRSGGILEGDIRKKGNNDAASVEHSLAALQKSALLSQEYVVICKQSQKQVNRVDQESKIKQMGDMGVLCSCGNSIANERIEELFLPSALLKKMLDQSYWMSAHLIAVLQRLGVSKESVLLNLQEGAEEIDAFVDLDGTLLMFELKDNEFSMGHAYPFGGRIGLYKPKFAFIVATKGIAPDVKQYFGRVKPGAQLVYVENLSELASKIGGTIENVRLERAREIISQFQGLAEMRAPLFELLTGRLKLKDKTAASARPELVEKIS